MGDLHYASNSMSHNVRGGKLVNTRRFAVLLVLIFLPWVSQTRAQSSRVPEYFSVTALRDSVTGAAMAPDGTAGRFLGGPDNYKYIILRRDRSGEVELHERWDDVVIVQEGAGIVLHGGQLAGERLAGPEERGGGPGERRGGTITGGARQPLIAGDVMVIPAGIPHQVLVDPDGSITYVLIKVAPTGQQAKPGSGE